MRVPCRAAVAEERGAHGREIVAGEDHRHAAVVEVARLLCIGELLELMSHEEAVDRLAGLAIGGGDREIEVIGHDRDTCFARARCLGCESHEVVEDGAGAAFVFACQHGCRQQRHREAIAERSIGCGHRLASAARALNDQVSLGASFERR